MKCYRHQCRWNCSNNLFMKRKMIIIYYLFAIMFIVDLNVSPSYQSKKSYNFVATAAILLSDIPTPSFVIDLDALSSSLSSPSSQPYFPYLQLTNYNKKLSPVILTKTQGNTLTKSDERLEFYNINQRKTENHAIFGYLHSSVIRAREDANQDEDETFLAEVDLTQSLCCASENMKRKYAIDSSSSNSIIQHAQLVLGLNNHHVGSYYWARSAGSGASMEAPGVVFQSQANNDNKGILRWEAKGGPLECNSNDGKRSEWVNFLRIGDNVQFLPYDNEESIMSFINTFGGTNEETRIYGVSTQGRPLGSEPLVVCKWVLENDMT